ncbi:MAG: polysaccharide deacetylase family protein [Acidobacteriia bacterium]|nr:polysaccharide deacetylase family protein [Terriglobia bacterium]
MIRLPQSARRRLRSLYIRILYFSGLLWWAKSRIARDGVVVLTLHRVLPEPEFEQADCQKGMLVRDTTFDGLLSYLRARCECVPLLQPGGQPAGAGKGSRVRVALTFDDGWRDNYHTALPLALRHEVPFTVFICPGFIEHRETFWPAAVVKLWRAAERSGTLGQLRELWRATVSGASAERDTLDDLMDDLKPLDAARRNSFIDAARSLAGNENLSTQNENGGEFLTWQQIKEMAKQGVAFGSHTDTHRILPKIPVSEALRELQVSRGTVEFNLKSCSLLAYPNGDWSETVRTLASQCGYRFAFANSPGVWKTGTNPFSIPRVNIWEGKLAGDDGKFSRLEFEYAAFWLSYRK